MFLVIPLAHPTVRAGLAEAWACEGKCWDKGHTIRLLRFHTVANGRRRLEASLGRTGCEDHKLWTGASFFGRAFVSYWNCSGSLVSATGGHGAGHFVAGRPCCFQSPNLAVHGIPVCRGPMSPSLSLSLTQSFALRVCGLSTPALASAAAAVSASVSVSGVSVFASQSVCGACPGAHARSN